MFKAKRTTNAILVRVAISTPRKAPASHHPRTTRNHYPTPAYVAYRFGGPGGLALSSM